MKVNASGGEKVEENGSGGEEIEDNAGGGEMKPPRFMACRVKDRLSRAWDAETSGGNRDLLINGELDLGGKKSLIVEVQIHLAALFALKHDLHVLYAGARILGATDDLTIKWEGKLASEGDQDDPIKRANRGVLRKLGVSHSHINHKQAKQIHNLLHKEPCPLLTLDLSQCYVDKVDTEHRDGSPRGLEKGKIPMFARAAPHEPGDLTKPAAWTLEQLLTKPPESEKRPGSRKVPIRGLLIIQPTAVLLLSVPSLLPFLTPPLS